MRRSAEEPENEKDDFQDAFRRSLHSYRAPVDPQGWSRLEETLNNDSKDKRRGFMTWLAAACAGLLLLSGSILGYLNLQKNNPEIAFETVSKSAEKVIVPTPEASGNKIASAEVETQKVVSSNTFKSDPEQNKATETKELNTLAANNKPANSAVPTPAVSQNAVALAFENAKVKNSKTGESKIAFNTPENGIAAAGKVNETSVAVALDEENTEKTRAIKADAKLARNAAPVSGKEETVTLLAQNAAKNGSLSEEKSQASVPENSEDASGEEIAKNNAANSIAAISLDSPETGNTAKASSLAKGSPEAYSRKATSSITAENSVETFKLSSGNSNNASDQMLAVNSEKPADSSQALPGSAQTALLENSENAQKTNIAAGISKWSLAIAYSGLKFEQQISIGPNPQPSNNLITSALPTSFKAEQEFNENTKSLYSSKTQIMAGYQLASAWILQGGIDMSSYAAETTTNYMIRRKDNYGQGVGATQSEEMPVLTAVLNDQLYPDSVEEVKREQVNVKYSYSYIGVPVALQGQLKFKDKFFAYAKAGATLSRLVKSQIQTNGNENEAGLANTSDSYQKWQLVLNGGAGLGFKANRQISFNTGAEVNCFTQGLIKENHHLTSTLPYSFGINAGLTYQF